MFKKTKTTRAYTLVEAVMAIGLIGLTVSGSLVTIQWNRLHSRTISQEMVGQNVCASLMEMVKRSGYNEINYGADLPDLLEVSNTSSLLNFPAGDSVTTPTLPHGAAGNASTADSYYMTGSNQSSGLSTDANWLSMSQDQIAALNGYADANSVPDGINLLDQQLEWGIYIEEQGSMTYPVKLVVVVVKWKAHRNDRDRFTTLRTLVSNRTSRI